jgi:hypothetical protein
VWMISQHLCQCCGPCLCRTNEKKVGFSHGGEF